MNTLQRSGILRTAIGINIKMITPKKHLGQHFLRDENIAQKIVGYLNPEYPLILEIGPGMGVLTKYIFGRDAAQHIPMVDDAAHGVSGVENASQCIPMVEEDVARRVSTFDAWFMEVDRESVAYLNAAFPQISNRLILADFLTFDLNKFPPIFNALSVENGDTAESLPKFTVIGNFPYNISTQILFKALEYRDRIPEVIGMFQKEVAERIASPPGNKTYGIISVLLQAFYHIDYLFTVSETVFYPPPKVKSAVIRLRRNQTMKLDCDETLFVKLVKMAFNQRRKTLRNAIRPMLPVTLSGLPVLSQWLINCLDLRAEQLSVDDFVKLASEISTFA